MTSPVTVSPTFKARLILRFEDGTEADLGVVTYRPDVVFSIEPHGGVVSYRSEEGKP